MNDPQTQRLCCRSEGRGVSSEQKTVMAAALPRTDHWKHTWSKEKSAPKAQWPVLKTDTPIYSTLEAVTLVRAPWAL